jgi:hypothetical protein
MKPDKNRIESNLRLHVDRLAGLIGPRYLQKPKTIQATIGYIEGQWARMGYQSSHECSVWKWSDTTAQPTIHRECHRSFHDGCVASFRVEVIS